MKNNVVVLISGKCGTSVTKISKLLAEKLHCKIYKYDSKKNSKNTSAIVERKLNGKKTFVVEGRLCDYFYGKFDRTLSIFLDSPYPNRLKKISYKTQLPESEAAMLIERVDGERKTHFEYHTHEQWGSSKLYDYVIDVSGRNSYELADEILTLIK